MNPVHDNDIHQRVVDLNHLIGPFDLIAAWDRVIALARGLGALVNRLETKVCGVHGRDLTFEEVPHATFKAPSFLPTWMVAYTYPQNVNSMGVRLPGCEGTEHCNYLPLPVFPTPFYEIVACLLLFGILLLARPKIKLAGGLFCLYLVLNGFERFFIEKIRVNTKYEGLPFQPTQAELISLGLIILGIVLYFVAKNKAKTDK